jgi:ABC-2 type transport system permease protein
MSARSVDGRSGLRRLVEYYKSQLAIDISLNIAYRGATAIWTFSSIMQPLVSMVVWRTVAGSEGGSAGGLTANEYTAYFIMVLLVSNLTFIWHMWEFEWRIRTGAFSPLLLRPIHPIHNDVSENLSFKLIGLMGIIPAAVLLGVIFNADFGGTSVMDIVAFVPALVLAMVLRFVVEWTLALAAFWLTKVSAINNLFDVMFLFLGGQFAPLDVMPEWIRTLALLSPFPWSISFPVEVALGRRDGSEILVGYAAQLGWIAIAGGILALVWRRATSTYSAVGA